MRRLLPGHRPLRLGIVCAALAVVSSLAVGLGPAIWAQGAVSPEGGQLLFVNDGAIWRFDLATNQAAQIIKVPDGIISDVSLAADGRRLAYSVNYYDQQFRTQSSDIVLSGVDGANSRVVVHDEGDGYFLGWVSWPSEPDRIVYGKVNWGRGFSERVEDVDLTTGERRLILDNGSAPSASPTDTNLAYQTHAGTSWNIWRLDRGSSDRAEIVPSAWFQDADHPTFSPDGAQIAFVAAGPGPTPTPSEGAWSDLLGLGRARLAEAHDLIGVLFDLWMIRPDGGGLRQVATLLDQEPEIAWSPSGRFIVAYGSFQLQVVEVATGATHSLPRPAGASIFGGPIAWGPAPG